MKLVADVVTLYETHARVIPDMLRMAATNVEKETEEDDRTVAMIAVQVTESGDLQIYGWGQTDEFHCLGVLAKASACLAVGAPEE